MKSNYEVKTLSEEMPVFWTQVMKGNSFVWNNSIPLSQIIKDLPFFQKTSTFLIRNLKFSKSNYMEFFCILFVRTDGHTHTEIKKCVWWKQASWQAKGFASRQLVLKRWRVCSVWKRRELHFNFLFKTIFNIFLRPFYQFLGVSSYIPKYFTFWIFSSLVSWLLSKTKLKSLYNLG